MTFTAAVNETALVVFAVVVGVTMVITYFASKRVSTATDFWAAGRGLTGPQNGFAIAGDYMSAASFLGIAGLIFLFGFDGFLYSVGFLVAFLTVLFLLAERMRNSGKYTIADVLAFRLNERPARAAAALGTLSVVAFYLIAQMVGAGVLIEGLVGIDFWLAVLLTGAFMIVYIVAGGMLATSWVQIIKAFMLMAAAVVMSVWVLAKVGNPLDLFTDARSKSSNGEDYLKPGLFLDTPARHRLARDRARAGHRRPAAHPDAVLHGARRQGGSRLRDVGHGPDRGLLRDDHVPRLRGAGDPRHRRRGGRRRHRQLRAAHPRGRARRRAVPGDHRRSGIRHHPRGGRGPRDLGLGRGGARHLVEHRAARQRFREGRGLGGEDRRRRVGALAIGIAIIGGEGLNVSFMVGLAFAVAASANFPALLLALTWRRFNTSGAVTGVLFGVISSIALVIVSPTVWPGADSEGGALTFYSLANPAIISVPLGFFGCWLGTMLAREKATDRSYDELYVRSETGLGAEGGTGLTLTGGGAAGKRSRQADGRSDGHAAAPVGRSGRTYRAEPRPGTVCRP